MYILGLFSWAASAIWGKIREVLFMIDMVPYSLIDNVYNLFYSVATENLINETVVKQVLSNVYVLVGIFAFFRIAMLLINAIINPDALTKQGEGLSKIFVNTVIMLVLLVITPQLFGLSREFASKVVEGNYIQRLFINISDGKNVTEPGDEMQRISIAAVLTLDEAVENDASYQNGKTKQAIQCLNNVNSIGENDTSTEASKLGEGEKECVVDGRVKWSKLASYNSAKTNTDDGKVFVYSYKPLVLTVTGWVIVYVLLSFTFDVAKRVIELAILEIISPLFIATIVDPRSMQNGPFKKWLKTLGNSYASLFLRLAAISIMLLCVRLLSYWKPSADVGAFGKLIILIAFLIFIKQLPKWFSNMLGIDGDGTGLGGLGIGKKIGSAALVGGAATKLGHGLAGNAVTGLGNARDTIRDNHNRKKQAYSNGLSKGLGKKAREARQNWYNNNGLGGSTYAQKRQALNQARKEARKNAGVTAGKQVGRVAGGAIIGGIEGFKAGVNADSLKAATANAKGKIGTFKGESLGLNTDTAFKRANKKISNIYDDFSNAIYGDPAKRYEAADNLKKRKKREGMYNTSEVSKAGIDLDKLACGYNDVKKLGTDNIKDTITANYANAKGYTVSYETDASGNKALKISNGDMQIDTTTMFNEGSKILGPTGIAQLATLQNQVASSALSESGSNAQYMNGLASSISSMQTAIANTNIPGLNADGTISINGASFKFSGDNNPLSGTDVKISRDSISDLRIAQEEAHRQMDIERENSVNQDRTPEERQESKTKATAFETLYNSLSQTIVMQNQLKNATNEMGELQQRQEKLKALVDSIGKFEVNPDGGIISKNISFGSDSERESYLSKQQDKLDKISNPGKEEK